MAGSVRTTWAPKALSIILRSILMEAGMVRVSLYPLAAATMARPMPVLPEVGSTRVVVSGSIRPFASASSCHPSLSHFAAF